MKICVKTLLVALILASCKTTKAQHEYQVLVEDKNTVHVKAVLGTSATELHLPIMATEGLPDGPAEFIRNLVLTDGRGNEIPIVETKNQGNYYSWRLAAAVDRLSIHYDIEMNHDQYNWPFGVEEISYRTSEGFMIVGRYLFVIPNFLDESYDVEFDLPESWSVSVPWGTNEQTKFSGVKGSELRDNVLFIGQHREEEIVVGATRLRLLLGPGLQGDKHRILNYLKPNMRAIGELFGSAPKSTYLVVLQEGPIAGGAFNQSYSMLIEKPVNEASSALWGHGMIHETFHLWNGRGLIPEMQMEWFREGLTEYLSIQLEALTNSLKPKNIEKKIENAYRRYFLSTVMGSPVSLQEAGENKDQNRMKIYGLGTFFALVLDIEIRHANGNKNGLAEVIRLMYTEMALKNKQYTLEDVIRYTNRVAGKDLRFLFDAYVTGLEPLKPNKHLVKGGLLLTTMYDEAYLDDNPEASNLEKSIRVAVLGPGS